ncbi:MAG: TadE/TadG family type IV pilus assembly protein [Phycisphaeraceae bacterium]
MDVALNGLRRRSARGRGRWQRRGISLLEAAMVLPIVLLLTFGLIEYAWIFLKSQQVASAARNGARAASLPDAQQGEVVESVRQYLEDRGLDGEGVAAIVLTPANLSDASSGEHVEVSVTVDYQKVSITGLRLIPRPESLGSSTTMAKEGP